MSAVFVIVIMFAMVAVFIKAVQHAVSGMPAWQAVQVASLRPSAPHVRRA